MIVVAGTIGFASQGDRDGAVATSAELQRRTRLDEPGCLAYAFTPDPVDATVMQVFELWADEASLRAHFAHPNYGAMRQVLRGFERSGPSSVAKYRVDRKAPVYDGAGVPRADFDD